MPTDKERMEMSQELKDILEEKKDNSTEEKMSEKEKEFKQKAQASIDLVNSTSAQANNDEKQSESKTDSASTELKDVLKGEQSSSNENFTQKAQASIDLVNSTSAAADNLNNSEEERLQRQQQEDEEDKRRKGHYALETFSKSMVTEAKNQLKEAYDEVSSRLHGSSSSSKPNQEDFSQPLTVSKDEVQSTVSPVKMTSEGPSSFSKRELEKERTGLDEEIEEEAKTITPETRVAAADDMNRSMTKMERQNLDEETERQTVELKQTNGNDRKEKIVHAPFSRESFAQPSSSLSHKQQQQQQENPTLRQEATQTREENKVDYDRDLERERLTVKQADHLNMNAQQPRRGARDQIGVDEEVERETKTITPETREAAADNMDRSMTRMERQNVDEETEASELKPSNRVHTAPPSASIENPTLRQEATQVRESERERMAVKQASQNQQYSKTGRNGQIGVDEEFERETKTISPETREAAADKMDRSMTRLERQSVDEETEASEMKPSDKVNNNNKVSVPEQASADALNVTNSPFSAESASMVSGEESKDNPTLKSEATQTPLSEDQRSQQVYNHHRFTSTAPVSHYHDQEIRQKKNILDEDIHGDEEEMASSVIQASDAQQQQQPAESATPPTSVETTNSKTQDAVNFVAKAAAITAKQASDAVTSTVDNLISGDSFSPSSPTDDKSTIKSFEQSVSSLAEQVKDRASQTIESAKQTVESLQSQATATIKQGVQQMTGDSNRERSNTAAAGEDASKLPQQSTTEKMNDAWDASKKLVADNIESGKRIMSDLVEPTPHGSNEQQTLKDNSFLHKTSTVIETVASAGELAQQATSMVVQEALDAVEGAAYAAPHAVSEVAQKLKESIKEEASIAKEMLKDVKDAVLGHGGDEHSMNALENVRPNIKSLITSPYSSEKASKLASEALESAKAMTNQATMGASAAVGKAMEYVPPREKVEEVANQSLDAAKSASMGAAAAVGKAMEYVPPREKVEEVANQSLEATKSVVNKAMEYVPPREKVEEVANESLEAAKSAVNKAKEYVPPREDVESAAKSASLGAAAAVGKAMEYIPPREDVESAAKSASLGAAAAVGKAMEYVPPQEKMEEAANQTLQSAKSAVDSVTSTVSNVARTAESVASSGLDKIESAGSSVVQGVESVGSSAVQAAGSAATSVVEGAKSAVHEVQATTSSAVEGAESAASSAVQGVKSVAHGVQSTASSAIEGVESSVSSVAEKVESIASSAVKEAESAASSAVQGVQSVAHGVQSTASSVVEGVESSVSSAAQKVVSSASSVVEGVESSVSSVAQGVQSTASSVVEGVESSVSSVAQGLQSTASSVVEGVESTVNSAAQKVGSTASSVAHGVESAVQGVESTAASAIQGVGSTASSVAQHVESAASSAVHGVESGVKSLVTSPQKVIEEISTGTEASRELYAETMSTGVQNPIIDPNHDSQSTRAVRTSLMNGLGKLAFEEFNNASPDGDFQPSFSNEQSQQNRTPVHNNSVPIGQAFANEVLESVKDHGEGDFDAGIRPKKLVGLDSSRKNEVDEEELARIELEMDGGDTTLPMEQDKPHMGQPRGLMESIKYKVKTTWGIVNEQLPIEFVYQLKAEEEEEKQHNNYEDKKGTNQEAMGEAKETRVGKDLIDTIEKAQQRIGRAFGMSSRSDSSDNSNRASSPPPPSRNDSSQGIASSAVGSAYNLSTRPDYVASSLSSATYVGNDQQPSAPLESEVGLPDLPTDDITEEFMAMSVSHKQRSSPKPTVHSFGTSLKGRKLMTEWPESLGSPSSSETATSVGFWKWPESVESPSTEQTGILNRLKTRAKRLFGLKDDEADESEQEHHLVDNSPESIEPELEPQGNEVGGLAKEMILGHKDALRPGDGIAKSGREMDEISHRIIDVRRQIYGERKEDCETGVVPQIDDIPGGIPIKSVETKKKTMGVEEKKGWIARMLSRAKL